MLPLPAMWISWLKPISKPQINALHSAAVILNAKETGPIYQELFLIKSGRIKALRFESRL